MYDNMVKLSSQTYFKEKSAAWAEFHFLLVPSIDLFNEILSYDCIFFTFILQEIGIYWEYCWSTWNVECYVLVDLIYEFVLLISIGNIYFHNG